MKMHELRDLRAGVLALAAKELPVRLAYRVAKVLALLNAEWKHHEEFRRKLAEKHGERTGTGYQVKPAAMEAFTAEYTELLLVDVEIEIAPIMTAAELESLEDRGVMIAPADLERIAVLIGEKGTP